MSIEMPRTPESAAQNIYDGRSSRYDDSWHPRFARHMVELAHIQPGEDVLDLACGTGLVTFNASRATGLSGSVIGIDISSGMLEQAHIKLKTHNLENITFCKHSITDLASVRLVRGRMFDVITCASALVLLERPGQAIKEWVRFLKPGGRLITDVIHPMNQIAGITFERVGLLLNKPLPFNRLAFPNADSLTLVMEQAGLENVQMRVVSQLTIAGTENLNDYLCDAGKPPINKTYSVQDADTVFENAIGEKYYETLASPGTRQEAKPVFKQEWAKIADEQGRIQEVDGVFLGIGTKGVSS